VSIPQTRAMTVVRRRDVVAGVVELDLAPADGDPCPAWSPGAHVDVVLPSGRLRQYSLCGDPRSGTLRIAVLYEADGRGGSKELHESVTVDQQIAIRGPRNHFELVNADRYLFVAGGIGITPVLAMVREVVDRGGSWTLVYGGRSRASMAYVPELAELEERAGGLGRVRLVPQDEEGLIDLPSVVAGCPVAVPIYACGPEPLLSALEDLLAGTPRQQQLHLERFAATEREPMPDDGLPAFEVELASSGVLLTVGPEDRIIDVVRAEVPDLPFSCEEGYCGSCETGVLAGLPCHRDQVLTEEERSANDVMMICVGRSRSPRITLDL
jgi:ferredoxin-NADP reductase